MKNFTFLLLLVLPQFVLAQWEASEDDVINQGHRVWSLKVTSDNAIWAASTVDTQAPNSDLPLLHRSADEGETWTSQAIITAPGVRAWDIAPIDSMNAFVAVDTAGVYKTEDGGSTWNKLENYPFRAFYIYFWNEDEGLVISADTINGLLVMSTTTDGGDNWLNSGNGIGIQPGTSIPNTNDFFSFTFSVNSSYDVHGSTFLHGRSNGNYWRSDDKGLNWINQVTPLEEINMMTSNIAMKDENTIIVAGDIDNQNFAGSSTISYVTTDGGETWNLTNPSNMTAAMTRHIPNTDSTFIMVGHNNFGWGQEGTAITYDLGETWEYIDETSLITMDFNDNGFGAATCCNNSWVTANGQVHIWDFELPTSTIELSEQDLNLQISPNPFTNQLIFKTNASQNLDITITDVAGRIWQQFQVNGTAKLSKNTTDLPKGIYLVKIFDGAKNYTDKLVKQ